MTEPDAADASLLQKSQESIDEAREAAKKVADSEDIEVGDLPAFADSTPDVDHANAFSDGEQEADTGELADREQSDDEPADTDEEPEK